jgi:hypothetical protein
MSDDPQDPPKEATLPPQAEALTKEELAALLASFRREHARINQQVDAIHENGVLDMLKLRRMKKAKLAVKDKIAYIENLLTPDIIA